MAECPGFVPSLWQPKKCIHCFKLHGPSSSPTPNLFRNNSDIGPVPKAQGVSKDFHQLKRNNSLKNPPHIPQLTTKKDCSTFVAQKWRPYVCLNCFGTISEHKQTNSSSGNPEQEEQPKTVETPPTLTLQQSTSSTATSAVTEEEEDDPFKDFEDLDDSLPSTSSGTPSFSRSSSLRFSTDISYHESRALDVVSSRISLSFETPSLPNLIGFVKYTEAEEEWDDGVDITSILSNGQYSYVNNKISEIASVKEEMERTQQQFEENPSLLLALFEILKAKQQQIQKAFERDKIDQQDHSKLLDSLSEVRTMLLDHDRNISLC